MAEARNGKVASWVQWGILVGLSVAVIAMGLARAEGRVDVRIEALEKSVDAWGPAMERLIRLEKDVQYIKLTVDEMKADIKDLKEKRP